MLFSALLSRPSLSGIEAESHGELSFEELG